MSASTAQEIIDPDPKSLIERARARHDERARTLQKTRRYFALTVAFVGPISVLLLAFVVSSESLGRVGTSLIIALECLLLLFALITGFLEFGESHKQWIEERLRAELLRREQFLLLAGVGPYLLAAEEDLPDLVRGRLLFVDSEINDPLDLIPMRDSHQSWKEALEDARASGKLTTIPMLRDAAAHYLENRIAFQRKYLASQSSKHRITGERLERAVKFILVFALVLSITHLMTVWLPEHPIKGFWEVTLTVLLVSSPAFGALFDHLASIFGSERLSRSYLYHAEVLEEIEGRLRRLRLTTSTDGSIDSQFRFMRLVLEAEELLSNELRFWWLVMYLNVPRAAA
jgi:hypothetical protein